MTENSQQTTEQQSFATEITDEPVGATVSVGFDDQDEMNATVATRTAYVPSDEWPEPGETVTFKAVGGHTDNVVQAVEKDRDYPIQVEHGGWYDRSNFVEYSVEKEHKVLELPDGRELWASPEDADE
jgi:hypothetical protein